MDELSLGHRIHGKRYGSILMCDCASCGREMLGRSMAAWYARLSREERSILPPMTHARLFDRPYCRECYVKLGISDLKDFRHATP